jgi:hypothetical protein
MNISLFAESEELKYQSIKSIYHKKDYNFAGEMTARRAYLNIQNLYYPKYNLLLIQSFLKSNRYSHADKIKQEMLTILEDDKEINENLKPHEKSKATKRQTSSNNFFFQKQRDKRLFGRKLYGIFYYYHLENKNYNKAEAYFNLIHKYQERDNDLINPDEGLDLLEEKYRFYVLTHRNKSAKNLESILKQRKTTFEPILPSKRPTLFWVIFYSVLFPGGGHFYQKNYWNGILSLLSVGGFGACGYYFLKQNHIAPGILSVYFALVFYQISIGYSYRNYINNYYKSREDWEKSIILASRYRF